MRKTGILSCATLLLGATAACGSGEPRVKHLNPGSLHRPTGYTHVVEVKGGRTLYVSGQIALDDSGRVVGPGDLRLQTRQAFENLKSALAASGATLADLVKVTVFMTDASQVPVYREVRDQFITGDLPASTLVQVDRLSREELLIEIEAVAVVP